MKILLVYPYFLHDRAFKENIEAPPIGLHYLAAVLLEAGHEVLLANWHDVAGNPGEVEKTFREFEPDVVGISIFNANRWGGLDVAEVAKELSPESVVVLGGIGATFLDELLVRHFPFVDYVLRGEGERAFLELVERLESGDSPWEAPSLTYLRDGKLERTPDAERIEDLDSLPMPAKYFTFEHISLSRGCPGKCTFCGSPRFWGPKVRFHSAEYFVAQLALLKNKGISFFYFSDDTFTLRKRLAIEICQGIIEQGLDISWAAISRVDHVDAEVLGWMRRAGCVQVSYGVESGSETIRRTLNKRVAAERIPEAFALTARQGMLARAYIIYGCPGESPETVQETITALDAIKPLIVLWHILTIFPGTALYEQWKERTGATDEVWLERFEDILYLDTDEALSEDAVREYGQRMKEAYFAALPSYARAVPDPDPADAPERIAAFADFLSRLGMTFEYGDYAQVEAIPDKHGLALELYRRALALSPDGRAFLGLALGLHAQGDTQGAENTFRQALEHFPNDPNLHAWIQKLGISLL